MKPVHRRDIFGRGVVCGEPWHPTQRVSLKASKITCAACLAKRAAFRKSAKLRAAMHGVRGD